MAIKNHEATAHAPSTLEKIKKVGIGEKLADKERGEIFGKNGAIVNQEVGYFWLLWKKEAGKLTEKNKTDLMHLSQNRITNRFGLADKELQNMGLSFEKLAKTYPEKAALLFSKIVNFHEYNVNMNLNKIIRGLNRFCTYTFVM